MLEMLSGMKKSNSHNDSILEIDLSISDQIDSHSLSIFSETAYKCLTPNNKERPSMIKIIKKIKEALYIQNMTKQNWMVYNDKNQGAAASTTTTQSQQNQKLKDLLIPLNEINLATRNFNTKSKIGKGGFSQRAFVDGIADDYGYGWAIARIKPIAKVYAKEDSKRMICGVCGENEGHDSRTCGILYRVDDDDLFENHAELWFIVINNPFWKGEEHELTFQTLKDKLCNAPILPLPDRQEDFVVYCDTSRIGLGCVLMQRGFRYGKTFRVVTLRAVIHVGDKTSEDARSWYMISEDAKSRVCDCLHIFTVI
nr:protein kinase, ATP binding site-containing protein [Tanacetum cinerariifolium]